MLKLTPYRTCLFVICIGLFLHTPSIGEAAPAAEQLFTQAQFEPARRAYAAQVLAAPGDAAGWVGLVRTLLRLDRWDEARAEAQAFTAKFPNNADAHGLLSLSLIRAGWQEPYVDEAGKSLTLDPQNYWGLMASGHIADWNGKIEDARASFHKASEVHPELPDAWGEIFLLDDDRGHIQEQLTAAQTYVNLNPQGHPHDELSEDARDVLAHSQAYRDAFEADPPYQHSEGADDAKSSGSVSSGSLTMEFTGDFALFPVSINGSPFRLLFDTGGGDDILLNWKAAQRLSLPVIAHSFVRGVSGKEKSDTLKAQTMTVAGRTYKSIKIDTADALDGIGDGILGGDILQDSVMTLDFEQRTASLSQGSSAQPPATLAGDCSVAFPFHFYHGDLYVKLALNGTPVWALIDTGAFTSTLSLRLARQELKAVPKEDAFSGSDNGRHGVGKTNRKMDYIASRDQSQITLSLVPPASMPMDTVGTSDLDRIISPSPTCDFEVSLWVGMSSLTYARRLTFDYPRQQLIFEYQVPDAPPVTKKK
ncbi:MAG: aspartyl protease family protein [Janthinobacterium lividum]